MPEMKPEKSQMTVAIAAAVFGLTPEEVLAFKVRDDDVLVVVTTAGQKHICNPHDPADVEAAKQRLTQPVENPLTSDSGEAVSTGTEEGAAGSPAAPTEVAPDTTLATDSGAAALAAAPAAADAQTETTEQTGQETGAVSINVTVPAVTPEAVAAVAAGIKSAIGKGSKTKAGAK